MLAIQIALPLRYYLQGGGEDERFSWRMFSSLGARRCQVQVVEVVQRADRVSETIVPLNEVLHARWIGLLRQYRSRLVTRFLAERCQHSGAQEVRYERSCTNLDGSSGEPLEVQADCSPFTVVKA
jgi:hypothetical protein